MTAVSTSDTVLVEFTVLGVTRTEFINDTGTFVDSVRDVLDRVHVRLGFSVYAVLEGEEDDVLM